MIAELETNSEIIQTKRGPIEINKKGNAPYILCLHGSPGIHDGQSDYFHYLTAAGLGVIAPSRPGFGRTPLSSGKTSEEAADLMAALLDELNLEKVIVYGISGGGPTTLNFALRHPNRCAGCMTEVAVTGGYRTPKFEQLEGAGTKWLVTSPFASRMMQMGVEKSPATVVGAALDESSLIRGPEKDALVREISNDPERMATIGRLFNLAAGGSCYS